MNMWVGIDPGASGAIAFLYENGSVSFIDNSNPVHVIVEHIKTMTDTHTVKVCMIEDVHSIYGTSAKSNFNFGFNTGLLHGIIRALGLPLDQVQPKAWQKHLGVKSTVKGKDKKKAVVEIVSSLYPSVAPEFHTPRGRLLDGRSDALALATYAKFKHS